LAKRKCCLRFPLFTVKIITFWKSAVGSSSRIKRFHWKVEKRITQWPGVIFQKKRNLSYLLRKPNRKENVRNCTVTKMCVCVIILLVKKTIKITYSECMFVALSMQHVMRMRRVICGLFWSTIFFHIISKTAGLKKWVLNVKCVFLIFSTTCVWNIFHYKKKWERYIIKNVNGCACQVPSIVIKF
jgi:hypothetical protein